MNFSKVMSVITRYIINVFVVSELNGKKQCANFAP